MTGRDRWVVVGLAHVRSRWFAEVAGWATAAVLPIDFVKCLSVEEIRARLDSGRAFSALLIDGSLSGLDRDLVDQATSAGCAVVVVDSGTCAAPRRWSDLGASATLPTDFDASALLEVLAANAPRIDQVDRSVIESEPSGLSLLWRGRLVTVLGAGGSGTSTVAMALATGFGTDARYRGLVLLADLALDADQALLHHLGDVVPGLQELVDGHRLANPGPDEIRSLTLQPPQSPYSVLMGLRRHRDWVALRPRAVDAALDGLRRTFTVTVADTDSDLEGDDRSGTAAVEPRNLLARSAVRDADLVLVTSLPTVTGLQRLVRIVHEVRGHGIPPGRIVPVVNRAPKGPPARSELTAAIAELTAQRGQTPISPTIFIPDRRGLHRDQRDAVAVTPGLVRAVTEPVQAILDRLATSPHIAPASSDPVRIVPGSLGTWADEEGVAG